MRTPFIFVPVIALALVGTGCTQAQRAGAVHDIGAYVGAQPYPDGTFDKNPDGTARLDGEPDYDPKEVASKAATIAASKAASGDYFGLLLWGLGGAGALGVGYINRKKIAALASRVKAAIPNPEA